MRTAATHTVSGAKWGGQQLLMRWPLPEACCLSVATAAAELVVLESASSSGKSSIVSVDLVKDAEAARNGQLSVSKVSAALHLVVWSAVWTVTRRTCKPCIAPAHSAHVFA